MLGLRPHFQWISSLVPIHYGYDIVEVVVIFRVHHKYMQFHQYNDEHYAYIFPAL